MSMSSRGNALTYQRCIRADKVEPRGELGQSAVVDVAIQHLQFVLDRLAQAGGDIRTLILRVTPLDAGGLEIRATVTRKATS